MITLSYGFQLPVANDKGAALFAALEGNIQQLNDHTHDGENSSPIAGSAIASSVQDILASGWAPYTNGPTGHFRQLVTMAPGYTFDNNSISIRTAQGAYAYPSLERNDATSFYIYTTDNSVSFKAVYGG